VRIRGARKRTYGMFPDGGAGGDVAARGIPFDVCDAVMVRGVHEL